MHSPFRRFPFFSFIEISLHIPSFFGVTCYRGRVFLVSFLSRPTAALDGFADPFWGGACLFIGTALFTKRPPVGTAQHGRSHLLESAEFPLENGKESPWWIHILWEHLPRHKHPGPQPIRIRFHSWLIHTLVCLASLPLIRIRYLSWTICDSCPETEPFKNERLAMPGCE